MCLSCLGDKSSGWRFIPPSDITGKHAGLQYCLRMIYFTHCYTLAINGGVYKQLSLSPSTTPPIHQSDSDIATESDDFPKKLLAELQKTEDSSEAVETVTPEGQPPEDEEVEVAEDQENEELLR